VDDTFSADCTLCKTTTDCYRCFEIKETNQNMGPMFGESKLGSRKLVTNCSFQNFDYLQREYDLVKLPLIFTNAKYMSHRMFCSKFQWFFFRTDKRSCCVLVNYPFIYMFTFGLSTFRFLCYHVMWVPITTERRVLGLRMEETASRYGRQLRIDGIRRSGQPTRGDVLVLGLGGGWQLTLSNQLVMKCYRGPRNWGLLWTPQWTWDSIKAGCFLTSWVTISFSRRSLLREWTGVPMLRKKLTWMVCTIPSWIYLNSENI
jgi:hypothetical protein